MTTNFLLFFFQLPRLLESHVAADINFRAATVSDYTDAINLLACYQGLPHPVKHGKSCSYPIIALFVTQFQIRGVLNYSAVTL